MKILRRKIGASTDRSRRYSVTAGMSGHPKAGNTVVTDKAYITKLAKGVARELEDYFDGCEVTYEITNNAIVFALPEFDYEYVQPLDGVVTYDSDLQSDISVLFEDVLSDFTPRF